MSGDVHFKSLYRDALKQKYIYTKSLYCQHQRVEEIVVRGERKGPMFLGDFFDFRHKTNS